MVTQRHLRVQQGQVEMEFGPDQVIPHCLGGFPLIGEDKTDVGVARLRLGQYRHFSPAGGTPGGPEVDQGRPLGQRLERNRSALQVLQGDFRQWRCVRGHAVKCGEREPHGDHCRGGAGE